MGPDYETPVFPHGVVSVVVDVVCVCVCERERESKGGKELVCYVRQTNTKTGSLVVIVVHHKTTLLVPKHIRFERIRVALFLMSQLEYSHTPMNSSSNMTVVQLTTHLHHIQERMTKS